MREFFAGGGFANRGPQLRPGYYTVETLRNEIEQTLNFGEGKQISGDYSVIFNDRLARYSFYNTSIPSGEGFSLYTDGTTLKLELRSNQLKSCTEPGGPLV